MSRTIRSLLCAASMLALATSAAHAQTAPATTTASPSTPAASSPSSTAAGAAQSQLPAECHLSPPAAQVAAANADVDDDDAAESLHDEFRACFKALRDAYQASGEEHH